MSTKVLTARVPGELAEWADSYAVSRGSTRQAVIRAALVAFRRDCAGGVPDLPEDEPAANVPTAADRRAAAVAATGGAVRPASDLVPVATQVLLGGRQRALNEAKARRAPASAHGKAAKS